MSDEDNPASSSKRREFLKGVAIVGVATGLSAGGDATAQSSASPKATGIGSKPPTKATLKANAVYANKLSFDDTQDFKDASRGPIASLPDPGIIPSTKGGAAWDLGQFEFITGGPENNAPGSVNLSLWRNAKLNMNHGLFEVIDGIWQVRGYDLSVMSIIRGDTGWIVIDPLMTADVSVVVWKQLVIPHLGDRPITHVIYTHSYADHYGGIRGIVDEADLTAGKVKIYAPADLRKRR
jgi:alkyl sulfatase BDS1-like metallo-beta-lactamase superfamily hydrolase